ncbi:shikimate kinase [Tissierella sp.]|uniref:shikimate kinase n=1 Tax=Tissierella sp. TaxID=41274 RepID=UPI002854EC4F|nr:shikimate kinase [Tissierella sp.]MDR7855210.1 shikimate kinase [Tissierella sp.]
MSKPHGIIVFGANGSGKSTLGRELASVLNFKYMDIEDYHFHKSEIPYTLERSQEDCLNLMLADIKKYNSFVLSAVTGDFGEKISSMYVLAVLMSAPVETRMDHIGQRESEKHGERIQKGGDMYEQHFKFVNFARFRNLSSIDKWTESLNCPIICVDGTKDYRQTAVDIANQFQKI